MRPIQILKRVIVVVLGVLNQNKSLVFDIILFLYILFYLFVINSVNRFCSSSVDMSRRTIRTESRVRAEFPMFICKTTISYVG